MITVTMGKQDWTNLAILKIIRYFSIDTYWKVNIPLSFTFASKFFLAGFETFRPLNCPIHCSLLVNSECSAICASLRHSWRFSHLFHLIFVIVSIHWVVNCASQRVSLWVELLPTDLIVSCWNEIRQLISTVTHENIEWYHIANDHCDSQILCQKF